MLIGPHSKMLTLCDKKLVRFDKIAAGNRQHSQIVRNLKPRQQMLVVPLWATHLLHTDWFSVNSPNSSPKLT